MPEEKKNEKMVDIDTTGPGAEIELPEENTRGSLRLMEVDS